MSTEARSSQFRVEKLRVDATIVLSSGDSILGCFFTAGASARHAGPERVAELLNDDSGFFPFESVKDGHARTALYNRAHVALVTLRENEGERDPGYAVAVKRTVSILLANGQRIVGAVGVQRPQGRDRLSDWTRQPEAFRYLHTGDMTLLVNVAHIVDVSEVPEP